MNKKEIQEFEKRLLELRCTLREDEESSKESRGVVELDQTRVGRISRMDAMQSQQMALETARRRQQLLLRVDGALNRIETGEYGYCFVCGEEINIQRLLADPVTTRCLHCAN